ncbi:hypothetical protein GCM10009733_073070 [Nonomuraea maheshkhaliensis]|uniref:Uncharacterized protein n=1 Tax=Nonomuraea maheshkhaliensis TaxID=419590 RepID=A0ABN2G3P2_9ACTN
MGRSRWGEADGETPRTWKSPPTTKGWRGGGAAPLPCSSGARALAVGASAQARGEAARDCGSLATVARQCPGRPAPLWEPGDLPRQCGSIPMRDPPSWNSWGT